MPNNEQFFSSVFNEIKITKWDKNSFGQNAQGTVKGQVDILRSFVSKYVITYT